MKHIVVVNEKDSFISTNTSVTFAFFQHHCGNRNKGRSILAKIYLFAHRVDAKKRFKIMIFSGILIF